MCVSYSVLRSFTHVFALSEFVVKHALQRSSHDTPFGSRVLGAPLHAAGAVVDICFRHNKKNFEQETLLLFFVVVRHKVFP